MKLRRAVAVAAATAVITPAAFLMAPTAHAEDGVPSTAESSPSMSSDEGTKTTEQAPSDAPSVSATPLPTEEKKPEEKSADGTAPAPSDSTSPGQPAGTAPGEDGEGEEGEELPYCEEVDENFEEKALDVRISGLPGKIVAGSGWKDFDLTITNKSKLDLKEVVFFAEVENFEEDESKWLSKYVDLQFKMPNSDKWVGIGDEEWAGGYFWGVETMKPKDFVEIDLRVRIDKAAPAGDSYAFGTGGYVGDVKGQECLAENSGALVEFAVLKPGSSVGDPGEAAPGDGRGKDVEKPDTKPQGGVEQLPVTGNLAETGSDSMLPVIGIAGGVALVAGTGVVFALRRRQNGATA
ncbi:LPXTG cell wall anchor domain-containing protein [Streptomyces somaliensis DSM 40738]|uniref:LAETG motif-containing sortase-dependent surface protein n=1 Tax=Streptomyces somaliensis TaxID=78355 RepID=UPI0021C40C6B|nr:LAETG motif-containing sortase-dependent surface protein [Streptomyces somaliensis]MCQ0024085.1 LPXTG cell wall anchor domain-containing protein [Streptomyces somaliensis DSM 40738]